MTCYQMLENAKEYPFFSNVHVTFAKIDHILGHKKKSLDIFKKVEKTQSMLFSFHKEIQLRINNGMISAISQIFKNKITYLQITH